MELSTTASTRSNINSIYNYNISNALDRAVYDMNTCSICRQSLIKIRSVSTNLIGYKCYKTSANHNVVHDKALNKAVHNHCIDLNNETERTSEPFYHIGIEASLNALSKRDWFLDIGRKVMGLSQYMCSPFLNTR